MEAYVLPASSLNSRREVLDDNADLSAQESLFRNLFNKRDDGQEVEFSHYILIPLSSRAD